LEPIAKLQIFLRFFLIDYTIILILLTGVLFLINGDRVWDRIDDIIQAMDI